MTKTTTKLTKNFTLREVAGSYLIQILDNLDNLAKNLQVIRDTIRVPLTVSSGFRNHLHNRKVGGRPNSQHLFGKAADLSAEGVSPESLYGVITKLISEGLISEGGVGLYERHVHYDIRGTKARWRG